jgi:hypothetical protein
MPFTVSHIAAVVPFTGKSKWSLPIAALAAGSMAPDYLYFVPPLIQYGGAIHKPIYAFTAGLVMAIAAWAVWRVLAPGLHAIAPQFIRTRWDSERWRAYKPWQVFVAFLVGIATHLFLDAFTHSWGLGTTHIKLISNFYATPFGVLTGYEIAQNVFSGIGLVVLILIPFFIKPRETEQTQTPLLQKITLGTVPIAAVLGAVVRTAAVGGFDSRYEALAFYLLTGAVAGASVVAVGLSVAAIICMRTQTK